MSTTGQGLGRPRDTDIDTAVLAAARDLLMEVGYANVTMDATAARAGTSKAAIYRRFGSKAELLFAAALHDIDLAPPADTGSLRDDLHALARQIQAELSGPAARQVLGPLLAEMTLQSDVAARVRGTFNPGELAVITEILERATRRGQVPRVPDPRVVQLMLGGAIFFSFFVADEPLDDEKIAELVGVLVAGLCGANAASAAFAGSNAASARRAPRRPPAAGPVSVGRSASRRLR